MVYEWNSQLAKASWCQRERWHRLPYATRIGQKRGHFHINAPRTLHYIEHFRTMASPSSD